MKNMTVTLITLLLIVGISGCGFLPLSEDEYDNKYSEERAQNIAVRQDTTYYGESDTYDFGNVSSSKDVTFTIENSGDDVLHLTGTPTVSINGSSVYSIQQWPLDAIDPGTTSDFILRFQNDYSSAQRNADIIIASNDPDTELYTFHVTGYAVC
ncbi:MAG: DUF1573 domain-containing protein [Spirochaetales bacterium]|nr:DUF1573 domain-containing protein [Spirochaetales bacterium]